MDNNDVSLKILHVYILPSFEYCMPVWLSTTVCHLELNSLYLMTILVWKDGEWLEV